MGLEGAGSDPTPIRELLRGAVPRTPHKVRVRSRPMLVKGHRPSGDFV